MLPFAGVYQWVRNDALKITLSRVCALILVVLVGVLYAPYLSSPLVFDDFNVIKRMDFLDYALHFSIAPRWLPYATLAHTDALTSGSIVAMRLGNLLPHAATVIAVFVFLRELVLAVVDRDASAKDRENHALIVAFVAAALFAVHPVAVYGAGYLIQRTTLMSTLFMLFMLIAYLRWLVAGRSALWIWSAIWYLLSVLSKEPSVMAPVLRCCSRSCYIGRQHLWPAG